MLGLPVPVTPGVEGVAIGHTHTDYFQSLCVIELHVVRQNLKIRQNQRRQRRGRISERHRRRAATRKRIAPGVIARVGFDMGVDWNATLFSHHQLVGQEATFEFR